MKSEICCFTGHRELPPKDLQQIQTLLEREINRLLAIGVRTFLAGGALGFDILAAQTVLKLKEEDSPIQLVLVLPCRDQASRWENDDRALYEQIKQGADQVVYTAERYFPGCMHQRNRYLADHSGWCLCWLTRETGGTAYTVRRCRAQGVRVINLAGKSFNNLK